jgi:RNA polymerase sigma factor (sigma-70 family)
MKGTDLLDEFRMSRSEAAFGELVRRYTNLVYSVSKRRVSNASLAEEVSQMVFIRLAKAVPKLGTDAELLAWLHRTAINASIDLWRTEFRRRVREEQAAAMQTESANDTAWIELSPVLDEALNELNDAERQTLLMRFFDGKTMRELGEALGVSEDAAKMRVSRAMERLRATLRTLGVTCGTAMLAGLLTERAIEAAPIEVGTRLAGLRLPAAAGAGLAGGWLAAFLQASGAKLITGLVIIATVGGGAVMLHRAREGNAGTRGTSNSTSVAGSVDGQNRQAASAVDAIAGAVAEPAGDPDPVSLLETVAKARNRIDSGSMELQLTVETFQEGHQVTNEYRLLASFEGRKFRFEQFEDSYSYVNFGFNEGGEMATAKIKEQNLDRAAALKAGLLQVRKAHYVSVWDGIIYLKYSDEGQGSATVEKDTGSSSTIMFDPRCLGLRTYLFASSTVDNSLAYKEAKSVQLVGKDFLGTTPAWHVRVQSKHEETLDFWIDAMHRERVLKVAKGRDEAVAYYVDGQAVPTEVNTTEYPRWAPYARKNFIRSNTEWNRAISPVTWSLAGLGMKTNTPVVDIRIHQRIGYWTGSGLVEFPTRAKPAPQEEEAPAPTLAARVGLLLDEPASDAARESAIWIMLNNPDGPEVETAAGVIIKEHLESPEMATLSTGLERMHHRSGTKVLEEILTKNPYEHVRASACFTLGKLLKEQAAYGKNKKETEQAEKVLERVVAEFSKTGPKEADMARKAGTELYDLRNLFLGKPAPETSGEDLEGKPISLSDYRGKVVVLAFWCGDFYESKDYAKLVSQIADNRVVMMGVNMDDDRSKAKATVDKYEIAWPSIWDRHEGPIRQKWNVQGWPSFWVIDGAGVIRYRKVYGQELRAGVQKLLNEL